MIFREREQNEANEARRFADHFKTEHQEVLVTSEDFRRELPKIFAAMDQPTNDGVNTYFVSQAARRAGLTVVLSGLGGDEVFWGYRHYRTVQKIWRWVNACPSAARHFAAQAATAAGKLQGREGWMRLEYLNDVARSQQQRESAASRGMYLSLRGFFPPSQVARLLGISEPAVAEAAEQVVGGPVPSGPNGFNYLEFKRYMHDQLLRDSDVFSMAHSIELRVPLLDHKIVEYAARLTPGVKLKGSSNKPVLVGAVDDPLLFEAAATPQTGIFFPDGSLDEAIRRRARRNVAAGPLGGSRRSPFVVETISCRPLALVAGVGADGFGSKELSATRLAPPPSVPPASPVEIPVLVLQPTKGFLKLKLGDVWEYRELLYFLVWRDVKVRYKQTALGAAWAILQPV